MTFAEEIKELTEIVANSEQTLATEKVALTNSFEYRIMSLESDLDNAHDDIENEKALTKKLKGKLDGMVELVGELVMNLNGNVNAWCSLVNSGDAGNWNPEGDTHIASARVVLTKAKESMP